MDIKKLFDDCMFLLGAGASKDAGCYLSQDMLDDLEQFDLEFEKEEEKEAAREALEFLISNLEYHSKWKTLHYKFFEHQPNIEELILLIRRIEERENYVPFPVTGNWADKIVQLESRSPDIFTNLREGIERKLPEWLKIGKEDLTLFDCLDKFFQSIPTTKLALDIFTLNYDLTFERRFNRGNQTLVETGFSSGQWVGFGDKVVQKEHSRIFLYKLHGSINWSRLEDSSVVLTESIKFNEFTEINNHEDQFYHFEQQGEIIQKSPFIIFGYGGKFLSVEPFLTLLYEFKRHLEQKRYIVVIGYSFFDPYINNMLFEGLTRDSSKRKKLIVINKGLYKELGCHDSDINSNENRAKFTERLSYIQKSAYLSDLPEYNITSISPNLVYLINHTAKEFYDEYFQDKASKFCGLLNSLSKDEDQVFS